MIIAVDGPAASGKGTLSQRLAAHYRLAYLDTGALYRAVARDVLARGGNPADAILAAKVATSIDPATLNDPALRSHGLGEAASVVASLPPVRQALFEYQRRFAQTPQGAILDGRDIGTVICPDADVKLFATASPEERARRRYLQLRQAGVDVSQEEVLADIRQRDERDSNRAVAPLHPAADAHLLDTTNLDIDAAFRTAIDLIDAVMGRTGHTS
jgi:cytidylate kinase